MSDAFLQLPVDSIGKLIDMEQLTVSGRTVYRQRIEITGPNAADIAPVSATVGVSVNPAASSKDIDSITVYQRWGTNTWAQGNLPAVNTAAVTTKAAAGAGFRHVCTGITASFAAGTAAPTAINVVLLLRDGASGVGTVLWAVTMSMVATAGATAPPIALSDLTIRGSENTAMCLEFGTAGGANTFQCVALQGAIEAI